MLSIWTKRELCRLVKRYQPNDAISDTRNCQKRKLIGQYALLPQKIKAFVVPVVELVLCKCRNGELLFACILLLLSRV